MTIELCVCVCVCVCLHVSVCEKALKQHSLPQSNKGENGDIVAHTDDEDEPQGKGEVFHVSQLYHFTWHWRSTNIQISPSAELAGNKVYLQVNLERWFDIDKVKNKQSPPWPSLTTVIIDRGGETRGETKDKTTLSGYQYPFSLLLCGGSSLLFCRGSPTPGHRLVKTDRSPKLKEIKRKAKNTWDESTMAEELLQTQTWLICCSQQRFHFSMNTSLVSTGCVIWHQDLQRNDKPCLTGTHKETEARCLIFATFESYPRVSPPRASKSVRLPIMSDVPSAVYPGEPTASATLLYTQPMMFMFTVLPLRRGQRRRKDIKAQIHGLYWNSVMVLKHAELRDIFGGLPTSRAMLSWRPNTRFSSFPLNQFTAYVFWATAKDSPPTLNRKKKTHRTASRMSSGTLQMSWTIVGHCRRKWFSHPNTKRPSSQSQNWFVNAPVANMTLAGKGRKRKWSDRRQLCVHLI